MSLRERIKELRDKRDAIRAMHGAGAYPCEKCGAECKKTPAEFERWGGLCAKCNRAEHVLVFSPNAPGPVTE